MKNNHLILKIIFTFFCSMALVYLIFHQTQFNVQEMTIEQINGDYVPRLIFYSLLVWGFRSLRVYLLYSSQNQQQDRWRFLMLSFQAVGIQNALLRVTPLRLGEAALPITLHRYAQIDYAQGFYRLFLLRLCEFIFLVFFLLYSIFHEQFSISTSQRYQLFGIFVCLALLLIFLKKILMTMVYLLAHIPIKIAIIKKIKTAILSISDLSPKDWYLLISMTFMILISQYYLFDSILLCCGIDLSIHQILIGGSIAHFSNLMPVPTIGNIGTHEIGWVSAFVYLGVSQQTAVLSAIFGQWTTLLLALFWGLISYLLLPLQVKNR
jgi:hypothetical protein